MSEDLEQPAQQPAEPIVEPSKVDPATEANAPTLGTKLFVIFFMCIVPPLGFAILVAVCWTLFKLVMAA